MRRRDPSAGDMLLSLQNFITKLCGPMLMLSGPMRTSNGPMNEVWESWSLGG